VKSGPTETEEVHFLLQVSSKLKQESYLVNFFLEVCSTVCSTFYVMFCYSISKNKNQSSIEVGSTVRVLLCNEVAGSIPTLSSQDALTKNQLHSVK